MSVPEMKQDQKQGQQTIAHIVALKFQQRVTFAQTVVEKFRYFHRDLVIPKEGNRLGGLIQEGLVRVKRKVSIMHKLR